MREEQCDVTRGPQARIDEAIAILLPHRARNEAIDDARHEAISRAWTMLTEGRTPEENAAIVDNPSEE